MCPSRRVSFRWLLYWYPSKKEGNRKCYSLYYKRNIYTKLLRDISFLGLLGCFCQLGIELRKEGVVFTGGVHFDLLGTLSGAVFVFVIVVFLGGLLCLLSESNESTRSSTRKYLLLASSQEIDKREGFIVEINIRSLLVLLDFLFTNFKITTFFIFVLFNLLWWSSDKTASAAVLHTWALTGT